MHTVRVQIGFRGRLNCAPSENDVTVPASLVSVELPEQFYQILYNCLRLDVAECSRKIRFSRMPILERIQKNNNLTTFSGCSRGIRVPFRSAKQNVGRGSVVTMGDKIFYGTPNSSSSCFSLRFIRKSPNVENIFHKNICYIKTYKFVY